MILLRKNYSRIGTLNTNAATNLGFTRGRKYDEDFDRLGRMSTAQRELHRVGDIRKEQKEMNSELRRGINVQDIMKD